MDLSDSGILEGSTLIMLITLTLNVRSGKKARYRFWHVPNNFR